MSRNKMTQKERITALSTMNFGDLEALNAIALGQIRAQLNIEHRLDEIEYTDDDVERAKTKRMQLRNLTEAVTYVINRKLEALLIDE